jgi:glycosyltransferase involved in cell wall biosynthesis
MTPRVSVVLSTCNRRDSLARALKCLLVQPTAPTHEIVVVDNRSTDGTRELVEAVARDVTNGTIRYAYEGKQGLSHARNAGIALARAPIIAFTDDDVLVDAHWIPAIARAFECHPEAWFVGGRVLPLWQAPPAWLTPIHWSPLALQDHGPEAFHVGLERPLCLVGANMAFRAEAFRAAGFFSPDVQLMPGMLGSTEDHELMQRIWRLGGRGVYEPSIVVRAEVQPERLTRRYHRRWHYAHGRSHARMRLPEMERSRARIFDVPVHLFRQAFEHLIRVVRHAIRRRAALAFQAETGLWFVAGFVRERIASPRAPAGATVTWRDLPPLPPEPLVSIVIPCFNQARYLPESIGSALAQSYRPVEVIVVDDGSTDGTTDVASRFDGVRCLRQTNQGLAHARNAGLAAARGRCIVFLDADDRLHPEAVTRGIRALAGRSDAGLAFGRARVIDADGTVMFTAPEVPLPDDGYAALLESNIIWTPGVAIFRREALGDAGGFDASVHAAADYDLYLRIARRYAVVGHGEIVADYRHHPASMSRRAAVMLRTTLAVHRRQQRHARGDPAYHRAYREGRRFWQRFFGDQLMDEIREALHSGGRPGTVVLGVLTMARHAPRRLAWHVARWLRNSGARSGIPIRSRQP